MKASTLLIAVSLASMADAHQAPPRPAGQPPVPVYLSLMGEPFRGEPRGPTPLAAWFEVADRSHDGRVSLEEMLEDAARFFRTLDTDGNGTISPIEMARYETDIAPARVRFDGGLKPFRSADKSDNAGFNASDDRASERDLRRSFGPGRNIRDLRFLEVPQPVMMADSDFDQRVSADEFATMAAKRFKANDKNRGGFLEPSELTAPLNKKGKPIGPGQVW